MNGKKIQTSGAKKWSHKIGNTSMNESMSISTLHLTLQRKIPRQICSLISDRKKYPYLITESPFQKCVGYSHISEQLPPWKMPVISFSGFNQFIFQSYSSCQCFLFYWKGNWTNLTPSTKSIIRFAHIKCSESVSSGLKYLITRKINLILYKHNALLYSPELKTQFLLHSKRQGIAGILLTVAFINVLTLSHNIPLTLIKKSGYKHTIGFYWNLPSLVLTGIVPS